MRTVELKSTVGGRWALTHGAALADGRADVLIVIGVPDDTPNAEVIRLADKTLINLPIRAKEPAKVEFGRLGVGNIVNLVIGRPPVPDEEKKDVQVVTSRMEGAERRAKFKRLGRAWLERAVDEAVDPR